MLFQVIKSLIALYRATVSPLIHLFFGPGYGCRFHPSCSQYVDQSFQVHGLWKGAWLSFRRISRCHPFAEAGYDPVPHVIAKTHNPHLYQGR